MMPPRMVASPFRLFTIGMSHPSQSPAALRPSPAVVITLGLGQIMAWGSSYYLIAVLAAPIVADTGWDRSWVVGGLALGFFASGLASPRVGRMVEAWGGRPVMMGGAVLMALGLAGLGAASNLAMYFAAWIVLGVAMGAALYDPAFATLGRLYGERARSAITQVTLFGGFASTVCWPLSAWLDEHAGWRATCFAYA